MCMVGHEGHFILKFIYELVFYIMIRKNVFSKVDILRMILFFGSVFMSGGQQICTHFKENLSHRLNVINYISDFDANTCVTMSMGYDEVSIE